MLVEQTNNATKQAELTLVIASEGKASKQGNTRGSADASNKQREDTDLLKDVLDVTQQHMRISDVGIDFTVHGETGRIKVSVTNKKTGDLIREIPPEKVLNLMAKLDEMMGIIFDEKA
jgi:flagellar protein FlaG